MFLFFWADVIGDSIRSAYTLTFFYKSILLLNVTVPHCVSFIIEYIWV